ncbi:MAG TPA: hypothetical protein VM621_11435 [Luteibacter sp.]|uniref:hypothetical protein n=1 Tax=Luteibacter sp. TaxID=1886636 RepID=UPI002D0C6494|nr:hypothetical protein [Luteibacter sp.]HVI55644.1 hypothetical protein [Luteibacter sp.]
MKSITLALLLGIPLMASAQMRPGTHGQAAPTQEPMKRFAWRDEAAGYTFVAPPRWSGKVKAVPLDSKALATSGATSGVRFVAGSKTLLVLLSSDDERAHAMASSGARELSRHDGHVVSLKTEADSGALALTDDELASAIQWDGGAVGTASR